MAHPVRTCAGCGRRASQSDLLRFAAPEGRLVPGRTVPGRGVYTCRSVACFRLARERRGFARVLRRAVTVEPELERLYTDADG
jgi:predicted RNA-binding protein YlxR (DUF448 family)